MLQLTLLLSILFISIDAYQIFPGASFFDAEQYCSREYGVHLVSIHNEETNNKIGNLLYDTMGETYGWIGLNQFGNTSVWTDNTPLDYNPGYIESFHEICTAINTSPISKPDDDKKWIIDACAYKYPFICNTRIAGDYDSLIDADERLMRIKFTSTNGIQVIWPSDSSRDTAIGAYFDPVDGVEYGTGYMYFPDDKSYDIYYYPNENTIYWDNIKGKTDNIWVKHVPDTTQVTQPLTTDNTEPPIIPGEFECDFGMYRYDDDASLAADAGYSLVSVKDLQSGTIHDEFIAYMAASNNRIRALGSWETHKDCLYIGNSGCTIASSLNSNCIAVQSWSHGVAYTLCPWNDRTTIDNGLQDMNPAGSPENSTIAIYVKCGSNDKDCLHFGSYAANQCTRYVAAEDVSIGYYCIDSTTVEERYFSGADCNPDKLTLRNIKTCESLYCNCAETSEDEIETECESVDLITLDCSIEPVTSEISNVIINKCLNDFEDTSYEYVCIGNELILNYYAHSVDCNGQALTTIYNNECNDGIAYSSTCYGHTTTLLPTGEPTEQPTYKPTQEPTEHELPSSTFPYVLTSTQLELDNECLRFNLFPVNECSLQSKNSKDFSTSSMGYYCIDENNVEQRFFDGEDCNPDNQHISGSPTILPCEFGINCNCNDIEYDDCDTVLLEYEACDQSELDFEGYYQIVTNQCLRHPDFDESWEYFCDGNVLTENWYTDNSNCNGNNVEQKLYDNTCQDGIISWTSSCEEIDTETDCPHYGANPVNECGNYIALTDTSIGYYCVDNNPDIIEKRYFSGTECNENLQITSNELPCNAPFCNCDMDDENMNNECLSVVSISTGCDTSSFTMIEANLFIKDTCFGDFGSTSYKYVCNDNEQLVLKYYTDSVDCSSEPLNTVYTNQCDYNSDLQVAYYSSCSDNELKLPSTSLSPILSTLLPSDDNIDQCLHYNKFPINECLSYGQNSLIYQCIDENTVQMQIFDGDGCILDNETESYEVACEEGDCNCIDKGNECEIVTVEYKACTDTTDLGAFSYSFIINKCYHSADDLASSVSYYCDDDILTAVIYDDSSTCEGNGIESIIHGTCDDGDIEFKSSCFEFLS